MTERMCIELASGALLIIVVCLMDFSNTQFLRDLVISIATGLIASVITDYNHSKDDEEKEILIFLAVAKPFNDRCNELFSRLRQMANYKDFLLVGKADYPTLKKSELSFDNAKFCMNDAGARSILNTVQEILKSQSVLVAVNHPWVFFQEYLKEIYDAGAFMDEIWENEEYGEEEKISKFCDFYNAITKAYATYERIKAKKTIEFL